MSFKCQIFTKRLTCHNVLEISCDVRIIILFCLIAILPPNIKCAKLPNPQIRLLINDDDLLHEKTSRHEAAAAAAAAVSDNSRLDNSGEHFNLYRSELKRLSYETIHRILRDENEPSYRREETELRYYQKRSPPAYEESHQLTKRSPADNEHNLALNYSKRNLRDFLYTPQLAKELTSATSLDLSDNRLAALNLSLIINDNLHSLNLSNNSFSYIPLSEKSPLKSLNLNFNSIRTSAIPANVYLRNLFLSFNRIENLSSLSLSLLKNLEILDISCNSLKNLETSFFPERMHNLKHLNLAHNQLGAIYRETFYNLLSLNTLLLGHNNITDIDYETFLALPNLQYLDLSFNRLRGKSIRALQGITGLVALNIAYNPELGPFMQEFVASWSLKELDASGTGLCQIPAALAQSVRSLKLTHNWLKVINCGDLDSYPLLQYLDLSFSHVQHIEDDALGRLEILEILMLDNNDLKRIPLSLPVSLEHLFLQNNNIMDIQAQSFQGLTSLKTLDLSHNKLLYLPDIALPKLQTLNLQAAEIRGISQGIVHTLPRLNELMLEDNPIKCADLLGIAEWASTCRLRTTKEELPDNSEDVADELDEPGKVSLKYKYLKMNNFYEKFEGEHCPQNLSLQHLVAKPSCAGAAEQIAQRAEAEEAGATAGHPQPPKAQHQQDSQQLEVNVKGSKTEVENFNFNAMVAATIPVPAKKAVKTLSGNPNKTATITADLPYQTSTTPIVAAAAAVENQQILHNNRETFDSEITTTTAAASSVSAATSAALASADKPQEHSSSTKQMKMLPKTTTTASTTASNADAIKEIAIGTTTDSRATMGTSSSSNRRSTTPSVSTGQDVQSVVGVEQTSPESLRTANLPETLKENVAESIIKKDSQQQEEDAQDDKATTTTTTAITPTPTAENGKGVITTGRTAYGTAINSPKPETATTMTTTARATEAAALTDSTATPTITIAESVINRVKEKLQHAKGIKTKIGPTKEIKSLQASTVAPASSALAAATTPNTPPTEQRGAPSEMPLKAPTKMPDYSNTSNKELNDSTTSRTIVTSPTTSGTASSISTTTLMTTAASIDSQETSTSNTAASAEDKDLASHSTGNDNHTTPSNGPDQNMAHTNGQHNKTLVTLHITMPITPNFVLHANDQHPQPVDTQANSTPTAQQQHHVIAAADIQQQHHSTTTGKDVNAKCNCNATTTARPHRQENENVIGKAPTTTTATTTTAATTKSTATAAAAAITATVAHKHEPLQLHIKDRHLIGTPLLMHKGDNLMVAADELIKASMQDSGKPTPPGATTATARATGTPQTAATKSEPTILDRSQTWPGFKKTSDMHHEPFEHKGETIKPKDYMQFRKSNADTKTKKPSLIMKKMTIITKQHEATTTVQDPDGAKENEIHPHQQRAFVDSHYQELKPLKASGPHELEESEPYGHSKHSTVNTPIHKEASLVHEPQTFQHEHELLLQQILHDEQHEKSSQSEQWSDLRKADNKDNHPGLILLVSSGLFVVLLLGLMHVYRCDVPWRRNSPAHHLRPHQRHNGSLDDDVHSFLSYNEGMQKWHHSTRLEAPYSSPLHNLHVRELQKTSATEKPATFKTSASSTANISMRTHILPRNNSQSSSATTRTTSPSSSAILDDETFYIEMTPPAGQFAQALQSELLPMELLNMAQTKSNGETKETCADLQTSLEDDYDFTAAAATAAHQATPYKTTTRSDLLTSDAASASAYNNKPLHTSRKFGLW